MKHLLRFLSFIILLAAQTLPSQAASLIDFIDKAESQPPVDEDLPRNKYFLSSVGIALTSPVSVNLECQAETCLYNGDSTEPLTRVSATEPDGSLPACLVTDANIFFLFEDDFTENADFRLVIPDGFFLHAGEPLTGCTLNYRFTYVEKFVSEIPYTLSPAPGETLGRIDDIVLTVPDDHSLGTNVGYSATMTNGATSISLTCERIAANQLQFSSLYGIRDEGTWTLNIPAGMINYDDAILNTPIEAYYVVKDLGLPKPEITPAEGVLTDVEQFNRFVLTLPEGSVVTLAEEGTYLCMLNDFGGFGLGLEYKLSLGEKPNEVVLTPAALMTELTPGVCILSMTAGAYYTSQASNSAYKFTFTYKPANALPDLDEAKTYTVHTFDGTLLSPAATPAEIRALPSAIYIINGRPVHPLR